MRILVVEDDKDLNTFIRTALKREGYASDSAADGKQALELAGETDYDVVLLDLMIPEVSGLTVLKQLRKQKHPAAILMVTSQGMERDKLAGLNSGADDYIVKPFLVTELIARIRAVTRRHGQGAAASSTILTAGNIRLDLIKHDVQVKGKPVSLTKKEFELLEHFMRHPGQMLSKSVLESHVWNMEFAPESNVVEVQVNHLREKLPRRKRPLIVTVRGLGYRFEP
jgi:DNA-binding response OmpR family regulator